MPRVADDDWPDDDFDESADDDATVECPHCGEAMFEDSPRCPRCGEYVSEEGAPATRKPVWIIIGTLLCLYIVYRWIAG